MDVLFARNIPGAAVNGIGGNMRKWGGRTVAVVIVVLTLVSPAPAGATNDSGVRVPNGQDVGLYYSNLDAAFETAVQWVRANRINPTDVQTIRKSASAADMRLGLANYAWPPDQWGEYQCVQGFSYLGVFICTDGRVRFHSNRAWDATNRRDLACHELGHALGLAHRGDGACMQAVVPYGAANNPGYGTHNLGHLNAWY